MQSKPNSLLRILNVNKFGMFKQKQIVEKGIIKHINGNRAMVEIIKQNPEDCKSCGVCIGIENKLNLLEVDTIPGLKVGQQVMLQLTNSSPYKSMILLLILPVVNLLIGSLLGQKMNMVYPDSQDMRMLLFGFVFFVLTILFVSIYDKKIRNKKHAHRKIISIDVLNDFHMFPR